MMTKEQMMDNVIRQRGFESKWTVWFCDLAEVLTPTQLFAAYVLLDANVLKEDEDEEEQGLDKSDVQQYNRDK